MALEYSTRAYGFFKIIYDENVYLTMWRKRNLIIASAPNAVVISASIGFYELGLNQGKDIGYQNGFSQGSSSVLIQMVTMISLKQNSTVIINVLPFFLPYNVALVYSF